MFRGPETVGADGLADGTTYPSSAPAHSRERRNDSYGMAHASCLRYCCMSSCSGSLRGCCAAAEFHASASPELPIRHGCVHATDSPCAYAGPDGTSRGYCPDHSKCQAQRETRSAEFESPPRAPWTTTPKPWQPPPVSAASYAHVVGNGNKVLSQAAVEAWAAAEAWAFTMAAATAATTGMRPATEAVAGGAGGDAKAAETAVLELAEPRDCFVASLRTVTGDRLCGIGNWHFTTAASTTDGLRENSAAHEHDSCSEFCPLRGGLTKSRGHLCAMASAENPSVSRTERTAAFFAEGRPLSSREMILHYEGVPLRGVAAVVLERMKHAEQAWRRHSQWTGMAMLRAHRLWALEQREMDARAMKHRERVRLTRGFKTMKARAERAERGREGSATAAAIAAATADELYRIRRLGRGMTMSRRNWQVCAALRSRDDLAELHFAESRVPTALRTWGARARAIRFSRRAHHAAARMWRSGALPAALARWMVVALGDDESRQRRKVWRQALIKRTPPLIPASANATAMSVKGSELRRGWDAYADHTGPEGGEEFEPDKPKVRPKRTKEHATSTRIERQIGDDNSAEDGLRVSPAHENEAHERAGLGQPRDGNDQQPSVASVAKRINKHAASNSDGILNLVLANNNKVSPRRIPETVANATLLSGNATHVQKRVPVMPRCARRRVEVGAAQATPTLALATMNNGLRVSREALVDSNDLRRNAETVKTAAIGGILGRCRSTGSVKANVGLTPRAGEHKIPHRSGDWLTKTETMAIALGMDIAETAQPVDGERSIGASSTMQTATKRSSRTSDSASPVGLPPEQGEMPENYGLDIDGSMPGISANIQVVTTARSRKHGKESRSIRELGNPPLLPDRERSSARKGRSNPSASPAGSREQSEIKVPCAEEPFGVAKNAVVCRERDMRHPETRISERPCLSSYARNEADLYGKESTDGSGTVFLLSQGVEDAEAMRCSGNDERRARSAATLDCASQVNLPDRSENAMTNVAATLIEQCRGQCSRRGVLSSPGSVRKVGSDPTMCRVGNGEEMCIVRVEKVLPLASARPMLDDGGLHVSRPSANPVASGSRVPVLSTASVCGGSGPSASERFVRCATDQEAAGRVLGALVAGPALAAADLHSALSSPGPSAHGSTPSATVDATSNGDSAVRALPLSSGRLTDPPSAGNASASFSEDEFRQQEGTAAGATTHYTDLVIEAAAAVENLLAADRHQPDSPRVSTKSSRQAETCQIVRHGRKGMLSSSSGATHRIASSTDSQFFAKDSEPQEPADARQSCSRWPRSAGNVRLPSSASSERLNIRQGGKSSTRFRSRVQMLESEFSSLSWSQRGSDRITCRRVSEQLSGSSGGERQRDGRGTSAGALPPLAVTPLSPSSVSALSVTLSTPNPEANGVPDQEQRIAGGVERSRRQLLSSATAAPLIATRTSAGSGGDLARLGSRQVSPSEPAAGNEEATGLITSPGAATSRNGHDNRPSIGGCAPLVDEGVVNGAKSRSSAFAGEVRSDSTRRGGNESQANRSDGSEVAGDSGDGDGRLQVRSGECRCSSKDRAELEPWLITSPPVEQAAGSRSSTGSSSRRGEATLLPERLSEAFLRRRLQRVGLWQWRLRFLDKIVQRRLAHDANTAVLNFIMRGSLAKWCTAHSRRMTRKSACASRISKRPPAASWRSHSEVALPLPAPAIAIVALRRWSGRSASMALLRRAALAWADQARRSTSVQLHHRQVLTLRGLSTWRVVARESCCARKWVAGARVALLQSKGRQRLRAWCERRRRRDDAFRAADKFRSSPGAVVSTPSRSTMASVLKEGRGWRRTVLQHTRKLFLVWLGLTRESLAERFARRDRVVSAQNIMRGHTMKTWFSRTAESGGRRRSVCAGEVHIARHRTRLGLRGLARGVKMRRERRKLLAVGDEHRRRRAVVWIARRVNEVVVPRRLTVRQAYTLRLHTRARAYLRRWRRISHDGQAIVLAGRRADGQGRNRMLFKGFMAFLAAVTRETAGERSKRTGQEHSALRAISGGLASWRLWTLSRAAGLELQAAGAEMHRARLMSVGLRGLARSARARVAQRQAEDCAKLHVLRIKGLGRWRVAATISRQDRAKGIVATVHWATTLLAKVMWSWEAAAVQRWACARQEEIAAQHDRRACRKRGLGTWAVSVLGSRAAAEGSK